MNRMIKTITSVLLCTCLYAVNACSRKAPDPVSVTTGTDAPELTNVPVSGKKIKDLSEEPHAAVSADQDQLEAIIAAKSIWYVEGDTDMLYAITDLDMNGRYEITAAKKNLAFNVYEVKDDGSGIDKVTTAFDDNTPGPYIEDEYVLRMNSDGEYLYVAREYDDSSNSDEVTIYYYVMCLSYGNIRANQVATEIRTTDPSGDVSVRYGDEEYEMSADEFKEKTDTGLPNVGYIQRVAWGKASDVAGFGDAKALEAICFKLVK